MISLHLQEKCDGSRLARQAPVLSGMLVGYGRVCKCCDGAGSAVREAGLDGVGDTQLEKLTVVEELEDVTAQHGRVGLLSTGTDGSTDLDTS